MKYLLVLCALLLGSCSTAAYDLTKMPKYSYEEVNARWTKIGEAQAMYKQLGQVVAHFAMNSSGVTEAHVKQINVHEDQYLYWIAVASIQGFHGDFEASDVSAAKAKAALEATIEILKSIDTPDANKIHWIKQNLDASLLAS